MGLFAAVGLGNFSKEIKKREDIFQQKIRDTKPDMHFLVVLADYFSKLPEIKKSLLFYPNNSIYKVGNNIRYVEYESLEGKRDYIISSAPLTKELSHILDFSKRGKSIFQMAEILINNEISIEESTEFIEELIDNQVLVSELEPNVSGEDFLEILMTLLYKIEAKKEAEALLSIKKGLINLDLNIGNTISYYTEIEKMIRDFSSDQKETQNKVQYEKKYLFQTDLYSKDDFVLSDHWKRELKRGISFLNKINISYKNSNLDNFKKKFQERFDTQEVPLAQVLDTELGIGYGQNFSAKGIHPYLDDLKLPSRRKQEFAIQLNEIQQILNEKLQGAIIENQYIIELFDEDFKNFTENWEDLPDTLSFMAEIISENNQEKLYLSSGGGSSAADLLGRFCSEKSEIRNLTKTIAKKEEELNPEYILAEIIHLPEARIGNVVRRPTLRKYEIPYLAKSILPKDNQITIDDLYISLKNNKIILRSKRLNKEIKPYLTNAHNYLLNTLPVYHFLSDLYSQNTRTRLFFSWGDLKSVYHFLPRIEYGNIILSKASWVVTEKELKKNSVLAYHKEDDTGEQLLSALRIWRSKRKIPQWIQWVQSDNKLTINLENLDLSKIFIENVMSLKSVTIEEFLYNENSEFIQQFIFPMYNAKKEKELKNSVYTF